MADPQHRDAVRRRIRTAFQTLVSASAVLLGLAPVVMSTLDGKLSPEAYAGLGAAVAAVVAGATLVQRVMSIPAVVELIDRHAPWLSADPDAGGND